MERGITTLIYVFKNMYQVGWVSTKVLVELLWGKNGILRLSEKDILA
jgi:hypothetical protein